MKPTAQYLAGLFMLVSPLSAIGFVSLSTGADGAFSPTVSQELPLPPDGVFNFTDVNIPAGVTITFARNVANTPVRIFATGDVTIDGTVNVSGTSGGALGDGSQGQGGPGGYNGGRGGISSRHGPSAGGDGFGPGRGTGGEAGSGSNGGGGSYKTSGGSGFPVGVTQGRPGPIYGNDDLLPLIGGSGGGGGGGKLNETGAGGGGGGGAILIAASGTVTVNGAIFARGGSAGAGSNAFAGSGSGGSGSSGAIRIMATTIRGEGTIDAVRNTAGVDGGEGRIRLETENLERTSNTVPTFVYSLPGVQLVPNLPSIRIASVAGFAAPGNPTGSKDIVVPGVTTNPVPVEIETTNVPVGTVVTVIAAPERGTAVTVNTGGVSADGSATANVNLPNGNSVLSAQTTFTVTASLGDALKHFAEGERVEKIELGAATGQGSTTTLITVSGKRYTWPSNAVAFN